MMEMRPGKFHSARQGDLCQPLTGLFACRAGTEDPSVIVIAEACAEKCELRVGQQWLQIFFGGDRVVILSANKLRPFAQSLQTRERGGFVCRWIRPRADAIIMAAGKETAPELGSFIVVQAKVVARDGTA